MPEGIPSIFSVETTRKWRALAERRQAHLIDLYRSGRWRLYYSEVDFFVRMREAVRAVERWNATEQNSVQRSANGHAVEAAAINGVPMDGAANNGAAIDSGAARTASG